MLHAMYKFMSRIITLSRTSAEEAFANLRSPRNLPHIMGPTLTCTLVNLQVKKVMNSLLHQITQEVLAGLEKLFIRSGYPSTNESLWQSSLVGETIKAKSCRAPNEGEIRKPDTRNGTGPFNPSYGIPKEKLWAVGVEIFSVFHPNNMIHNC